MTGMSHEPIEVRGSPGSEVLTSSAIRLTPTPFNHQPTSLTTHQAEALEPLESLGNGVPTFPG